MKGFGKSERIFACCGMMGSVGTIFELIALDTYLVVPAARIGKCGFTSTWWSVQSSSLVSVVVLDIFISVRSVKILLHTVSI